MVKIKGFKAYTVSPNFLQEMPIEADDYLDFPLGQNLTKTTDSFLKVSYPEFLFSEEFALKEENRDEILHEGKKNIQRFITEKKFVQEEKETIYVYSQIVDNREQTGFLLCIDNADYKEGRVVPHEQTFTKKIDRFSKGAEVLGLFNSFPIAFGDLEEVCNIILEKTVKTKKPKLEVTINGILNRLYCLGEEEKNVVIKAFSVTDRLYIADGHHRFESFSKTIELIKHKDKEGIVEDFNFFPIVVYPKNKLKILSYHRYVKNLKNFNGPAFIKKAERFFRINPIDLKKKITSQEKIVLLKDFIDHDKKGYFVVYVNDIDKWFTFQSLPYKPEDIIDNIDTSYLSSRVFKKILGLDDLTSKEHFEFHHEHKEQLYMIEKNFLKDKSMELAMICPRIKLDEVRKVADAKLCMPPKSTFVYPKPIIGLLFKAFREFQ